MAMSFEPTEEQRANIAARVGRVFGLPDAGRKIEAGGVNLEYYDAGRALLKVNLVEVITEQEANAIINGLPLDTPE